MKAKTCIARTTCPKTMAARLRTACAVKLLPLLLLLGVSAAVEAQLIYTTVDGTITITGYTGPGGAVIIPDAINGLRVTSIGDYAFLDCDSLTSVTIPDSVTSIGHSAFYSCTNLTSVTIGTNVTSIGHDAFGWTSLTSVTIPDSVTSIGTWAFENCTPLTAVYFKGNAPTVVSPVFTGDTNATGYYLPGTTGWGSTFGGCPTALWNPQAQSPGVRSNQFGFTITGTTNLTVVVEGCSDLANPVWSPVATNTLTDGAASFSDPQWTNYPARFYRLRSP